MRVLFTSGNGFLPQRSGGAQSSTDQLVRGLAARGHEAAVLCRLVGGGWTELRSRIERQVMRSRFSCDRHAGYPVFRAWDPSDAGDVVRRFRPDVAVVQTGCTLPIARSLEAAGVPVVLYFRNVEFEEIGGDPAQLQRALYIANSGFTASRYLQRYGVRCTVIPPLVERALYKTESTRSNVTFINPCPVKGLDIALAVAEACPDIPFVFVESWGMTSALRAELEPRLGALPNVTLRPRVTDMKSVYGDAKVVLAPSRWEEAWGRVATEAHCSGLPVVGSTQGGLPEAIGPGGTAIDVDAPTSTWVAAIRRLWDDPDAYEQASEAACAASRRPELQPDHQMDRFLEVLDQARSLDG